MFGVPEEEDEYTHAVVDDIFTNVLKANVNIVDAARTSPRDGRPGAIKVELASTYEKLQVLRYKSKCAESKKHE